MSSPFVDERLDNGLRVVVEVMPDVRSAACGFLVRTGSRDEEPELAGVSHFLEHMCFKGTYRRSWREINIEFDEMGSTYNAFTAKDRTFYYGWVRAGDIERQMELLADMMRSAIPPNEFDMEKNVILEEIAMSSDQIENLAYHLLHETCYRGEPMAWPVLGYERTIRELSRDRMHEYFTRRYAPDNMTFIAAGRVEAGRVVEAVRRLTAEWQPSGADRRDGRRAPRFHPASASRPVERFHQELVLMAFEAAPATDEQDEDAEALAAILGGDNSRFYWNIVQAGIAPRATVLREDHQDCGLLVLYGLCEADRIERLADAMRREAEEVTREGVRPQELQRVKNKRRTSLAAEAEAPYYRLVQIMEDVDYYGRPMTIEERLARVDRVTVDSIAAYLRRFPITGPGVLIGVGPRAWPPAESP